MDVVLLLAIRTLKVLATVQVRNMPQGRITLTHELYGSSPERSLPKRTFERGLRSPLSNRCSGSTPSHPSIQRYKSKIIDSVPSPGSTMSRAFPGKDHRQGRGVLRRDDRDKAS
jgi:hypothetical protein